ncbi:MAG TPA: hypothetical protein VF701_11115 [Thermoanaerobaculia bacterium]
MKQLFAIALLLLVATVGCTQKPEPVVSDTAPADPADRIAVAVEYVAIPRAMIFARPAGDAPEVGSYGLMEAVSILEKQGDWVMVRTFDGTGWMKQSDLLSGDQAEEVDTLTPRFYVEPAVVPARARGEIWLRARVDTDGRVIDVQAIKDTTGLTELVKANSEALKAAEFYPVVDKGGARKLFTYEHRVYY